MINVLLKLSPHRRTDGPAPQTQHYWLSQLLLCWDWQYESSDETFI